MLYNTQHPVTFGQYLRHVREELQATGGNFSLRTVAKNVGIEPGYLSRIERDEIPPPSEEVIVKLAAELGEDADVLLALGGKVSRDLLETIKTHPRAFAALIRKLKGRPEQVIDDTTREVRDGEW